MDAPARKRTKFMTNSPCIAEELSKRCKGHHVHQELINGRAKAAAVYPEPLCKAICIGLMRELEGRIRQIKCLMAVRHDDKIRDEETIGRDGKKKRGSQHVEDDAECQMAWDDLTGEELPAHEVRKARLKEVGYIEDKKVWRRMPRAEAIRRGIKIVDVRWIDINKGDLRNPLYRSRLVAKEFNDSKDDSLYAGTPPLEALRLLVSEAATVIEGLENDNVIMINDVARAFFEAPAHREICVELPMEVRTEEDERDDNVGILEKSLYGTRDAAQNFQKEVRKLMKSIGFNAGGYNACTYYHPTRHLTSMVHGDDFATTGTLENTKRLEKK